jgi:TonB family protein
MVKEKDKNLTSSLSGYQRYIRGEMTKREENSFLSKFQDDPFAEKATESISGISQLQKVDDRVTPWKLVKKWFDPRKRVVVFSASVLVAVLMIIYSIIIIADKNKISKQFIKDNVKPVQPEVTDSRQVPGLIHEESKYRSDSIGIKVNQKTKSDKIDTSISAGTNNTAIIENAKPAITVGTDSTPSMKSGTQVPDHSAEAAKKVVFTEFGISRKTDNKQPGYTYPQPLDGISNFDRYIEENMIKPLALTPGVDSVVVINFTVLTTGTIDSVKVLNSPGDEFTRKAMRLITEGPPWKPAENNGQTINDEVRIRMVFK